MTAKLAGFNRLAAARFTLVVLAGLLIAACNSQTVKKVNSTSAARATQELPQEALVDVAIVVFDPGLPVDGELPENVFPQVRRAEGRYIPFVLRDTMEATNHWGAVRVLPERDPAAELAVTGTVVHSDGFDMIVDVKAVDATGRVWLEQRYEDSATQFAYRDDIDYPGDPFQDLYNRIANDLLEARRNLSTADLREIRQIAQLRYAAELSPTAFGGHLREDDRGRVEINRLPSADDPMLRRVERIRQTEYLFVDTVDQQYGNFYRKMDPSYSQWRRYSYEETIAMEETRRSARTRMIAGAAAAVAGGVASSKADSSLGRTLGNAGVLGGLTLAKQGYDTRQQAKIHEEALKELATSFDAEVAPIVMQVEGEVIKLSGSLEAQYSEWRRLLREIYAEEVGLPLTQNEDGAAQ